MTNATVTAVTTALWILIEIIQFGYMAYLIWRNRNNVSYRNIQRARAAVAGA